jgi:hypothetical protein
MDMTIRRAVLAALHRRSMRLEPTASACPNPTTRLRGALLQRMVQHALSSPVQERSRVMSLIARGIRASRTDTTPLVDMSMVRRARVEAVPEKFNLHPRPPAS